MRFNPLMLQRPDSAEETITVSDPLQPGIEASFTLMARADALWREARLTKSFEYVRKYATGDTLYVDSKGAAGEAPAPLIAPSDNAIVRVTTGLCSVIATLSLMQEESLRRKYGADLSAIPALSPDRPLSFLEWAIMAERMGNAFEELTEKAQELINRAEGRMGNAPGTTTEQTQTETPNATSTDSPSEPV